MLPVTHLLPGIGIFLCIQHAATRTGRLTHQVRQNIQLLGRAYDTSNSTVAASANNATFPTSNPGCFPNIIASPVPGDPSKRTGTYYEYRSQGASEQAYNAKYTNSLASSGLVYLPGTLTSAVHLSEIYSYTSLTTSGGQQCHPSFIDILSRPDGQNYYTQFAASLGTSQPVLSVYYYLYETTGPRGFEIIYSCDVPNYTTGICEDPSLYVDTRVHPNSMTAAEQQSIDDTVDRVLKPYCFSKVDLQKVIFRDDLQACDTTPPQAFQNLVAGYKDSLTGPLN